jgi:hypothetical protein
MCIGLSEASVGLKGPHVIGAIPVVPCSTTRTALPPTLFANGRGSQKSELSWKLKPPSKMSRFVGVYVADPW